MKTRMLRDIEVSEVGMGCMAFSHGYGAIPSEQYSIEAIRGAYDAGCMFFDTAEVYGPNLARSQRGHNERIVGKALADVRDDVVIATKLFLDGGFGSTYKRIRKHLDASMDRLQTDFVDLYYLHRMGSTPVEEVADAMGRLIDEGLIGGWGLSQVDVDVIARAQAVTPLSAVQNIYSMVERDVEDEVIPYCAEHRIGLVAFSPVASGLLSGKVKSTAQFERVDDVRTWVPQLSERNLAANRPLVQMLEGFAAVKDCTPAQLSMAWMLAKWDNVVPIPGSKNKGRILENLGAAEVELTKDELAQLENALDGITVYGHRGFTR
ncbi:MAG: aldo/keto reductase [Atopobiaceae bacterium]|nr:aldo/keto reductase [Atopobiaceae bacterium]